MIKKTIVRRRGLSGLGKRKHTYKNVGSILLESKWLGKEVFVVTMDEYRKIKCELNKKIRLTKRIKHLVESL